MARWRHFDLPVGMRSMALSVNCRSLALYVLAG